MRAAAASGHQKIWGLRMALSLFLAGTAAGVYLVGFVLGAASGQAAIANVSIPASAILAVLAMVMLAWHTRRKAKLVVAFSRPRTSWMSRGAIALALFLLLTVIDAILWLARGEYSSSAAHLALGAVTSVTAIFILVYTGMLLESVKAIAFWDSVLLPVVFVLSGIAGGSLLLILGLGIGKATGSEVAESARLAAAFSLGLLVVEAVVVGLYLSRQGDDESAASAHEVLAGHLAPHFWLGAAVVGFVAPIVMCAYSLSAPSAAILIAAGITGLLGNVMLKYVIVAAGRPKAMRLADVRIPVPVAARMTVSQYVQEVDQKA